MNFPLEDKVALVTGGAMRLGRAIALTLARAGCDVIIHYRNSREDANDLAEEIRALGRQAWPLHADFSEEDMAEDFLRTAWETAGWIDILVNNAAMYSRHRITESEESDILTQWRVNTLTPMLLTKALAKCVEDSDILPEDYLGHVINILDRTITAPEHGALPYWVSKKALEAYTLGAAKELAPRITVNAIAPGPVLAPPHQPDTEGELAGTMLLATRCSPEDVSNAVVYLTTARCITGQVLFIDSGQHLIL